MNKMSEWFFKNSLLPLAILSALLAAGSKEASDIKFFLMSAMYQFVLWSMVRNADYYLNAWLLQIKVSTIQFRCIADLAFTLVPYIGIEKVAAILESYGIMLKDLYKDDDDKNRPFWKKKHEVPDWIKEIKGKLADMMAEPEMAGARKVLK